MSIPTLSVSTTRDRDNVSTQSLVQDPDLSRHTSVCLYMFVIICGTIKFLFDLRTSVTRISIGLVMSVCSSKRIEIEKSKLSRDRMKFYVSTVSRDVRSSTQQNKKSLHIKNYSAATALSLEEEEEALLLLFLSVFLRFRSALRF